MTLTIRLTAALMLAALACCANGAAAAELTREQAIGQLSGKSAALRLAGVRRLHEIGRFRDAGALAKLLFDEDEATRSATEAALWAVWSRSGDAKIDAQYKKGVAQMNSGNAELAIATFSEIIRKKPDFAEAWNKRATLYFFTRRYRESLADCDEVMKRNPHHFGALSGYGQIYAQMDDYDKALEYFEKAIAVNPNMEGVALNILALRKLRAERGRKAI